jgi:DNA-binding transcriptional LysR family regulator
MGTFEPETATQRIKLAIHEALEPMVFPFIYEHLNVQAPSLEIHSVKLDRLQLPMQLENGEVDFAIDVARPLAAPVEHQRVTRTEFCVLSHSAQTITLEQYQNGEHITVSNRATGKVIEDVAFAQLGFNRKVKVRCQNYQTACKLLQSHHFLLTLPRSIAFTLAEKGLVISDMPFSIPPVDTHLYWHENAKGDELMEWVKEKLIGVFADRFKLS